ncbi:GDP-fucose transporter 1-like isoform X2 [Homarus americanus]|uniref:GDP-fucose transporter 1-like n=2 Tax=Homarus americanus TaxID=6706 RepID=A0A8J5J9H8_HOMAM|nr:GDP-fucose transporter 1-like isoform X2 [Homarus americanus]KAG7153611.1 GDP-fucose transporter 1-like [Homarus americanus]
MEPAREESLLFKYAKITSVVCLYWTVSISLVFVNKTLLGGSSMGERDAPLFVTWFQCVVTTVSCLSLSCFTKVFPHVVTFPEVGSLERTKAKKVLPLTCVFVAMISMNNLSLKYMGVAFYFVGRSLTTVFNVTFTYLILGQVTSMSAILCCAVIIGGFWLGVDQENVAGSLSLLGVSFGFLSAAFVSLNAIYTKRVLPTLDGSIWVLCYYNNVMASVLFLPLIVFNGELYAAYLMVTEGSLHFWGLMVVGGFCGFAMGYVAGLQIQVTSPLTHNISGTAKACAQTVLATWWYAESKAVLWWLSNWVVLGGSLAYTYIKQLEMRATHNAPKPLQSDITGKIEEQMKG